MAVFEDTTSKLWDLGSDTLLREWRVSAEFDADFAAVAPDLDTAIFGREEELLFVDLAGQTQLGRQDAPSDALGDGFYSITVGAEGRQLAVGRWERVDLWDLSIGEGAGVLRFEAPPSTGAALDAIAFSPEGERFAGAGLSQPLKIWNLATGEIAGTLGTHADSVDALAFSPDGRFIAVAGGRSDLDQQICIVDLDTGGRRTILGAASNWMRALVRTGETIERITRPLVEE